MKEENILGRDPIKKLLIQFALPSIFALIISSLYNIVDQIFIGNSVGMLGNAATNVAFPLVTICTALALLSGIGGAANFNISLGRGQNELARLGAASGFNQAAILFVQILMNNFYRYYGSLSEYGANIPLAAVGIVMKVSMVFFCVNIGLSQGLQPISSFNYGAKNYDRVVEVYKLAIKYSLIVSSISFVIFQIFPRQIIMLFGGGSDLYFDFAIKLFRIMLFFTFLNGAQPVTMGFLTSIGLAKRGILISLLRQVLLLVPFAYIYANLFGVKGLLYAPPTADFITALITFALAKKVLDNLRKKSIEV